MTACSGVDFSNVPGYEIDDKGEVPFDEDFRTKVEFDLARYLHDQRDPLNGMNASPDIPTSPPESDADPGTIRRLNTCGGDSASYIPDQHHSFDPLNDEDPVEDFALNLKIYLPDPDVERTAHADMIKRVHSAVGAYKSALSLPMTSLKTAKRR